MWHITKRVENPKKILDFGTAWLNIIARLYYADRVISTIKAWRSRISRHFTCDCIITRWAIRATRFGWFSFCHDDEVVERQNKSIIREKNDSLFVTREIFEAHNSSTRIHKSVFFVFNYFPKYYHRIHSRKKIAFFIGHLLRPEINLFVY